MSVLSAVQIAALLGKEPPTAEQQRVIESPLRPALVVAGAGSGKTETMAGRVVWLLANGLVAPDQVLGLTFTRKAAGELEERVRRRLRALVRNARVSGVALPGATLLAIEDPDDPLGALSRPTVSTYHAYAAGLVGEHALRLGLEPGARLLGEAAQWQLAADVVEQWSGDLDTEKATSTVVDAVLSLSGALDEHLLSVPEARRGIEQIVDTLVATPVGDPPRPLKQELRTLVSSLQERRQLLDLVAAYRDRKRAADVMDFGDQVALAARLAREVPAVGASERDRYRVVLLDEYQDTSHAQLELLRGLFGGGHPVMAVGDPHQSIYGWRGASAGGLERFPTSFPAGDDDGARRPADVHQLSTSWRNDRAILDAANLVAAPLRAAAARRTNPVEVPVLAARPGAGQGRVAAVLCSTVEEEAAAVARFVAERWRPAGADGGRVSAAVLCRKRSQFEVLAPALRAAGLPVEVVGLGGLLSTPEVVDLVAALQAAHDPSRGDALMRLLTGARTRLGAADLHALAAWARELAARGAGRPPSSEDTARERDVVDERSIVDALDDLPAAGWRSHDGRTLSDVARARLGRLAGVLREIRRHTYLPLPELVAETERLLGLDIEVASRPGVGPARARMHLDSFARVADEFARSAELPTLGGFLAWLDAADARADGLELPVTEPDPDAVQLITVHAAKGLEWDVVAVPGLVDGVLPVLASGAEGPTSSGWLTGLGTLPYPLRGDRDDLPAFRYAGAVSPQDLDRRRLDFRLEAGRHEVAEERRLAYVALTRARSDLLLAGAWWGTATRPRALSPFLVELLEAGAVSDAGWEAPPEPGSTNPRDDVVPTAQWPADPFGTDDGGHRRTALELAAQAVLTARGQRDGVHGEPVAATQAVAEAERTTGATAWDRLADRLLAERAAAQQTDGPVELPSHLSASALVRLDADAARFAAELRRPVPAAPAPQARRGTAFHAWVEGWYGAAALVDLDVLPGADDDSVAVDADLAALRAAFLRSPWASRTPVAVEVDVQTSVDGYVLRSRIDAVFPDPDVPDDPRAVVVVDWKTGAPPTDPADRAHRELQLAVYRLAWSRWTGTPLESVRAAFCYVGAEQTVWPERLLGEEEIAAMLNRVTG